MTLNGWLTNNAEGAIDEQDNFRYEKKCHEKIKQGM